MPGDASEDVRKLALHHVLKTAAEKICKTPVPTCPKFLAVILDLQVDCGLSAFGEPYTPPAFIRSKQIDPDGRSTYVGVPVKATMMETATSWW
jgi:hypothetical protein